MLLVLSSSSLLLADASALREAHILDHLMSEDSIRPEAEQLVDGDLRSIEVYVGIAAEQMDYLEAGADFVRLGSRDQQKLAYDVKSAAIMTHVNCSFLNEDIADADGLMNWLQETLEDPVQMADPGLASVVLKSLALICKISPAFASTVSRILPRYLIQANPHGETVKIASKSLAFILKGLSKDALISTLYSLGNVLSPGSEAIFVNGQADDDIGAANGLETGYRDHQSNASSLSLELDDDAETGIVYNNVVEAICVVANASEDEKIIALAQSMLLQKFDKVNHRVDAKVISGAAKLAVNGGQNEFRSLLKMYARMCHVGIVERKELQLAAVSTTSKTASARSNTNSGFESTYIYICKPSSRLASLSGLFRSLTGCHYLAR